MDMALLGRFFKSTILKSLGVYKWFPQHAIGNINLLYNS